MQTLNQKLKSITDTLPKTGLSRFGQFQHLLPFSREKWRQLVRDNKAPQKIAMGERCTMYKNEELHQFFKDPLNYQNSKEDIHE